MIENVAETVDLSFLGEEDTFEGPLKSPISIRVFQRVCDWEYARIFG
jgi:hypothetical protein